MSILRLPAEIVALLVENLDVESIFNLGLTSRCLSYILYDRRICRLALLKKADHSAEAREARETGDFARAFRRLVKRRMAVRSAEPWTAAIVAMADRFVYTSGYLCYTVNREHLRVLNVRQNPSEELKVNVPLLLHAVRDYDPLLPYSFEPLYCAEGVLSCLATQLQGGTTCCWLIIFEVRSDFQWVVVKRLCSEHQVLIRNDKNYLFCVTKSHARIDGTYRWGVQRLDLATRQWSDSHIILWEFEGSKVGSDICFEIIDDHFYCVSNKLKTQTNYEIPNCYYQAIRFPVSEATHESCEKPLKRNLWRRHDSEGALDDRWTSLQLAKDEDTGEVFIIEVRREWFPGNAGSQRTCYKKRLRFGHDPVEHSLLTPPATAENSPIETTWDCEKHFEERTPGDIHVGDNPSDTLTYTLGECPVRSYNPSCEAFVDLVYEAYSANPLLQLRVRPKREAVKQELGHPSSWSQHGIEQTVEMWPPEPSPSQPDDALAQLHEVINPSQRFDGLEWSMDERILVYSPARREGQLRPVTLISFDPSLKFPGFPKYSFESAADAARPRVVLPNTPPHSHSQESICSIDDIARSPRSPGEWLTSQVRHEGPSLFVTPGLPLYQTMSMGNGAAHGFDMSYSSSTG
ncbi:F-box domain-containing protein [Fusarium falciforme]|uniref:F-box domain-containing protein n=1 Tax=Fusarium falciforme TaxID=195108 RepID=UPI0022FFD547|nr:F-box domain-containing protein [Fusarium falciforme]WAO89454.1 F-box domain-containing protein [Fusarium falciforme]